MFEKEIKFIGDFCFNKVRNLGNIFTLDKIIATGIHPAIVQYISAELEYMIYSDRRKLLQQSYFDYTGKEISDHFKKISNEIKKNKKISLEDSKKLIFQAVSFNINYLVRPKWSLTKLIFNDQPVISVEEMKMMLNYLFYYDYFKFVLTGYITKRNLVQISSTEFDLILNKIDRELLSSNQEQLIENSFTSIGDFFNIGGGDKNKISLTAVEIFFKEKNLIELLVKLQKAIPGEIKKQYDKQEIERILFSPERELETKTDKKEEPEEEPVEEDTEVSEPDVEPEFEESENNSSVGFEKPSAESFLTPEEEQALLSLYNEEPKVDEEIENTSSEMKTIESQDIEFENVETESTEEETITQLVEGPAEQVNEPKDEFEDIVDAISEDFNSEETKTEEQTIEEDSELIVTEIDKMADDTESEIKPGLEKEIVQEMIKDFYGEGESDTTIQDETEQESIEIPESVPEEESKNRIETLEDELLNIFEGLDKEDKPVEEVKETLPPEEEINEEKKPLKPKDTDGLDDYLKSIDEAVFSDKKEKMDEEKKEIEVKESVKEPEKKVEETKKDISTVLKDTLSRDSIEQPVITPRNIRPKDLFSYLRRKDIKKITLLIFGNDEEDFMNTAERIMDCHSYKEASEILKAVFTSYKISPYSKEAITFTNSVSNYFRQA
ncbi:MAG: hypothetical protein OQK52_00095 [Ignavibacteriaceae bacterium]|jgi:hypothetical protein|nr:hypothetical protein [Ignavibacteriaceae bacterium]MCW8823434.1 hypothetical protein [Ignavibacteriaceae bacterium]